VMAALNYRFYFVECLFFGVFPSAMIMLPYCRKHNNNDITATVLQ